MQNKTKVRRMSPLYPGMMVNFGKYEYVTVFYIGKHEFSWPVLPQRGHFLQSHVPIVVISSITHCTVRHSLLLPPD